MASLTDVLSVVQNGVVAFNNFSKQMAGSLLNISGQLTTDAANIASLTATTVSVNVQSFTSGQQEQARANIGTSVGFPDVIIEEQQPSGTNGGTFTSGSYQTRVLNTLVRNAGSIASLVSNQVTLAAGTYYFRWAAPGVNTTQHKTKLRNVTASSDVAFGTSEYAATSGASTQSVGSCVVTIGGSTSFSIQHQCLVTATTNGFGVASTFGTEVYTRLEITKLG
jgi:hypothetical protein